MFLLLTLFVSDKTTQLVNKTLLVENYTRPGHTPKKRSGLITGRVLTKKTGEPRILIHSFCLLLSLTLREVCKRNNPRFCKKQIREKQKENSYTTSYKLSLNLFVLWSLPGIFTDNPNFSTPSNNLALGTNFFHRGSYFHNVFIAVE